MATGTVEIPYRLHVTVVSRARGDSAVAKSAYRAGTRLVDERTGEVHDYSDRQDVTDAFISAPAAAPLWTDDRQTLWPRVEAREAAWNAQLAYEVQASLPFVLTADARRSLFEGFLRREFVAAGAVVDAAIHDPGVRRSRDHDPRNVHGHAMVTMRALDEDEPLGLGEKLVQWRPQFACKLGRRFVVDAAPLVALRERWAAAVNQSLEIAGVRGRVDHRSYAVRGIDREAEPKVGPFAAELERRGVRTRAGDERRAVQSRNRARERARSRGVGAEASQDGRLSVEEPGEAVYAGEQDVRALREAVLRESYGQEMAGSRLAVDWVIERVARGLRLRSAEGEVLDLGDRIQTGVGSSKEIRGVLDVARAKGWDELEFRGTDEFKRSAMRAALDEGFSIRARGHDAVLLAEVEHARLGLDVVPREGDAPMAAPIVARGGDQAATPATRATPSVRDLDDATKIARMLDEATRDEPMFTRKTLERIAAKYVNAPADLVGLVGAAAADPSVRIVGETRRGVPLYSTTHVVGLETRMVEDVTALAEHRAFPVNMARLEELITEKARAGKLSEQQADALRYIADPSSYRAVVGFAGAGKSTMLKIYKQVAQEAGYTVVGTALAAKAVRNLKSLGVEGRTLASYLRRWSPGEDGRAPREPLTSKHIVIPDEFGMVGTPDAARLLRLANEAGAKVVGVGDPGQLQPIEGGGAFALLLSRFGAARLTEVWRQKLDRSDADPSWMRKASVMFGEGNAVEAFRMYDERGFVREHGTRDEARAALVDLWAADRAASPGMHQLILASLHSDVRDLNARARAVRRERGELGPEVTIETPAGQKLPAGAKSFAVNDAVYFLHTDEKVFQVDNGSSGTVVAINGSTLRVKLDEEVPRVVDVDLMKYPDVMHGYALVKHKSQGATIGADDRAGKTYIMGSSFFGKEMAYVAMTRHTDSATFFWSRDVFANKTQLYRIIGRSNAKGTAIDYDVERTPAAGTYLRTPGQLERDLKAVLDTAKNLHGAATIEQRPAADRALASVVEFHDRVSFALEQLKSGGVATVAVPIHPDRFSDRVSAIERAALGAAAEVGRDSGLGRDDAERARVGGDEVERSRGEDAARATERPPEREDPRDAPTLPPPVGAIEVRAVDPTIVQRAVAALDSPRYLDVTAGLLLLTGRYPSEVLKGGEFRPGFSRDTLLYSGQAKARDADRRETQFEIPVLADPQRVLDAITRVRAVDDWQALTTAQMNAKVGKSLGVAVRRTVGEEFIPRDLRGAYVALTYDRFAQPGETRLDYAARVVLHAPDDVRTSLSYAKWSVEGQEARVIADYEAAAAARIAAIGKDLEEARAAGADAQAGFLEGRIEEMQSANWFAPVRRLDEKLDLDGVAREVDAALAQGREVFARAQERVAGLPELPPLPQHPEAAIAAELRTLRAEQRERSAFTRDELAQLRELESRRDASSRRAADELRAERARIRQAGEREIRDRERKLDSPHEREQRMQVYLRDLETYRAGAEVRERAAAELRVAEAAVRRSEQLASEVAKLRKTTPDLRVTIDGKSREDRMVQVARAVTSAAMDRGASRSG